MNKSARLETVRGEAMKTLKEVREVNDGRLIVARQCMPIGQRTTGSARVSFRSQWFGLYPLVQFYGNMAIPVDASMSLVTSSRSTTAAQGAIPTVSDQSHGTVPGKQAGAS